MIICIAFLHPGTLLWFVALPVAIYSFIVSNPRSSVEVRTPGSKEESDLWGQKKGACEGSWKVNVLQGAGMSSFAEIVSEVEGTIHKEGVAVKGPGRPQASESPRHGQVSQLSCLLVTGLEQVPNPVWASVGPCWSVFRICVPSAVLPWFSSLWTVMLRWTWTILEPKMKSVEWPHLQSAAREQRVYLLSLDIQYGSRGPQ